MNIRQHIIPLLQIVVVLALSACAHPPLSPDSSARGKSVRQLSPKQAISRGRPIVIGRIQLSEEIRTKMEKDEDVFIKPYYFCVQCVLPFMPLGAFFKDIDLLIDAPGDTRIYHCAESKDGWFFISLEPGEYRLNSVLASIVQGWSTTKVHIPLLYSFRVESDSVVYIGSIFVKKDRSILRSSSFFMRPGFYIYEIPVGKMAIEGGGTGSGYVDFVGKSIEIKDEYDTAVDLLRTKYPVVDSEVQKQLIHILTQAER